MSDVKDVHRIHTEPRYFMKKPVAIRAVQFTGDQSWQALVDFTDEKVRKSDSGVAEVYDYLHDTWVEFYLDDWILEGTQGEFYPHNGKLFETNYEEVSMPDKVVIEV